VKSETTHPPRTILDVFRLLPEGTLAEVIDGQLFMSPTPISRHQLILNQINLALVTAFEKTKRAVVIPSPIDVYLDETTTAVQPDLVVVAKENKRIILPEGHIHGVPDLVVEVLSPSNREFDLTKKKNLYERFGITEYWIVDPADLMCISYRLAEGHYQIISQKIGQLESRQFEAIVMLKPVIF
jgi:Uma2 family endonuclease